MSSAPIVPGLLVLHGNRLETLRAAVFQWLRDNPLAPLEPAVFLVQSNGVAEWLKIAMAEDSGVCAATRMELPGRFLWRIYRAMLGAEAVPMRSALDKAPLTWRLMQLLPTLLEKKDFAPLRHFLADGQPERRLQLAQRLADLFDQYQVYRADWLADWASGDDRVRRASGQPAPLADDQRWQAQLWRAVLSDVADPGAQELAQPGRAAVHQRFLDAVAAGKPPVSPLPRRVVLFGVSALPLQTMQALAALATHTQVVLAVPNPCQFYWGDIIAGRDLLLAERKRQQQRGGHDLAALPLEQVHAHSHPLLAAWGRQGRDFIRMLDDFDHAEEARARFANLRIDLFDEGPGETLLQQAQAAIRDLLPLAEHPHAPPAEGDRSIEFHLAHSVQREVEILHDNLLSWFAADADLKPRDVVVMVPDIEVFSPAIRAVFGQYGRRDARRIPFAIGDVRERGIDPLLVALDWLLRLPQQRARQSEIRDLLDVPALAARFGLQPDDLPRLAQWMEGSGVRWGLDQAHRAALGLGAAGEQNAWIFGLRRMLLGYASGAGQAFDGIEPYGEIGGLDAALAGSLAQLIDALIAWRETLAQDATPAQWGVHARALLAAFFRADDERDRLTLARLHESLQAWLEACAGARFEEAVGVAILREAWLESLDDDALEHQFVSGGVTFCTLMPMRAIPFPVVCLLGMNDGDYPRRTPRADFDLLAQPGLARPGDRARRDDDRYLMLEALLAARRKLYISWAGRHVRDNSEQPPSVLVSQLRDYLRDGWDLELDRITVDHPLQAFSRRYFEEGGLPTHAREWRLAHAENPEIAAEAVLPPFDSSNCVRLRLNELARFVKKPVSYFFRQRLGVQFDEEDAAGDDEEPFELDGLQLYEVAQKLLADEDGAAADAIADTIADAAAGLRMRAAQLARSGVLPIGAAGVQWQEQLVNLLLPARRAWLQLNARYAEPAERRPFEFPHGDVQLEDWLAPLRQDSEGALAWLQQSAVKLLDKKKQLRPDQMIDAWLRQLAAAAVGVELTGYLVGRDAQVRMPALARNDAIVTLAGLLDNWRAGMDAPLPAACRTALTWLETHDTGKTRQTYEGDGFQTPGEVDRDACLTRLWPDFASLRAQADWQDASERLYQPLREWLATLEMTPLDGVAASDDDRAEGEAA